MKVLGGSGGSMDREEIDGGNKLVCGCMDGQLPLAGVASTLSKKMASTVAGTFSTSIT